MAHLTLITGGARSGKSSFAEDLISKKGKEVAYIATAQAFDEEMQDRIARHQQQRPSVWKTFEEPLHPARILTEHGNSFDGFLLDCLTVLTTNIILQNDAIDWETPGVSNLNAVEQQVIGEIDSLLQAAGNFSGQLLCVTNEVGLGIVPDTPLSRFFRDCSGRVNQMMAAAADDVFLIISTIPMQIKGL